MRKHKDRYVSELERCYDELTYKCNYLEANLEELSKNYYELKKRHDRAAMHYWMYWFKMDEESAEDLEDKGWYLIIVPNYDHTVVAQYMEAAKGFKVKMPFENPIIHRDLVKYWADLPEPDLFDAVENGGESE